MKITLLETFLVPPRWCFLKIETDEGVVGWASRSSRPGAGAAGGGPAVPAAPDAGPLAAAGAGGRRPARPAGRLPRTAWPVAAVRLVREPAGRAAPRHETVRRLAVWPGTLRRRAAARVRPSPPPPPSPAREGGAITADLDPGWDVGGDVLNGGYLLAVAARAAVLDSPHPHPVALSASYLRATGPGRSCSTSSPAPRAARSRTPR